LESKITIINANIFYRDVFNIELADSHFSNETNFETSDKIHKFIGFSLNHLPGYVNKYFSEIYPIIERRRL